MDAIIIGLVWYVLFLFSTTVHEAAHALLAKMGGDLTAYRGGQVTLDPLPHIRREPFGLLLLPILATISIGWPFGYASCPYDPQWAAQYPRRAAWMALAGPVSNLLLVVIGGILMHIGIQAGVFVQPVNASALGLVNAVEPGFWDNMAMMASAFFSLNLMLFILNMIPLPPLDGGGAIQLLLPEDIARRYRTLMGTPALQMFGILIAWLVFDSLFEPSFQLATHLLYR
jgi:Zn-dependent protease